MGRAKATADPSTSLRSAQDDISVVMQSFEAGSITPVEHQSIDILTWESDGIPGLKIQTWGTQP
jgi:hypothetical protein